MNAFLKRLFPTRIVSFHRARVRKSFAQMFDGKTLHLSADRRAEVWKLKAGGVGIRIYRPDDECRHISCLEFALNEDAAQALLSLLAVQLHKDGTR